MDDTHKDVHEDLKIAVFLTTIVFLIEFFGGITSNSLALISDSAHALMDIVALALTYGVLRISARPSSIYVTFGYHRFEIFAALINGLTIITIAFFIFYEAYGRILSPHLVKGTQVLVIAAVGMVANTWAALRLHGHHDINIKGAYLHVLGDALASLAVIVGAVIIIFTGENIVDPLLSILIGAMLLKSSVGLVLSSARILLEFAPEHVDADTLERSMMQIEGVKGVHDIHIWSICSHIHAMSAHVLVDRIHVQQTDTMIRKIRQILRDKFRIVHTTLQFECDECESIEIKHESYH